MLSIASMNSVVFGAAKGKLPCCAPNQITRDTFLTRKMWTSYIDFEKMKVLEDWDGRDGVSYILLTLDDEMQYKRLVDGTCRKYPFVNKYARCVANDAVYYEIPEEENGLKLDGWKAVLPGQLTIDLVTRSQDCIAHSVIQTTSSGTKRTYRFFNTVASIDDPSVFDKDITDCV